MAFCSKCGAKLEDGAKFCPSCGNATEASQQTQNQQNQQTQNQQNQYQKTQGTNGNAFYKQFVDTPDHTAEFDGNDVADARGISILAYFGILFFVPLVVKPNSRYAKFHANQGLMFLITGVALGIINTVLGIIVRDIFPAYSVFGVNAGVSGFGLFLLWLFRIVCYIPTIYLFVMGLINACNGRAKELPLIGKFTLLK